MLSYVKFDDFGLLSVACMKCGAIVAKRTYVEIPNKTNPNQMEKVLAMQRLGNWRQTKVDLSDGSYADMIVCACCVDGICDKDLVNLEEQMKLGWLEEMVAGGFPKDKIDKHKERVKNLKLLKKEVKS